MECPVVSGEQQSDSSGTPIEHRPESSGLTGWLLAGWLFASTGLLNLCAPRCSFTPARQSTVETSVSSKHYLLQLPPSLSRAFFVLCSHRLSSSSSDTFFTALSPPLYFCIPLIIFILRLSPSHGPFVLSLSPRCSFCSFDGPSLSLVSGSFFPRFPFLANLFLVLLFQRSFSFYSRLSNTPSLSS